jgi:hypothetical protein
MGSGRQADKEKRRRKIVIVNAAEQRKGVKRVRHDNFSFIEAKYF